MLFVCKENKNNFSSTICLLSVSPRKHSAILDITHRTHAAYALLYPMQRCVFYVYLRFDLNKNSASFCWGGYRRAYAVCVRWVISKMALRLRGETERRWIVEEKLFFLCVQKVFSSQMDYPGDAFHSFLNLDSGIYLLGSQWDSHKPPGFYLKYFKLCSKDEQSFYGVGTTCG